MKSLVGHKQQNKQHTYISILHTKKLKGTYPFFSFMSFFWGGGGGGGFFSGFSLTNIQAQSRSKHEVRPHPKKQKGSTPKTI